MTFAGAGAAKCFNSFFLGFMTTILQENCVCRPLIWVIAMIPFLSETHHRESGVCRPLPAGALSHHRDSGVRAIL